MACLIMFGHKCVVFKQTSSLRFELLNILYAEIWHIQAIFKGWHGTWRI